MTDLTGTLRQALADRYALQREVGRGGMATVFLADDLKHGRPVAIKVLHPEIAAAIGTARFLREIGIAARMQHPHILPLYDSGCAASHLYYVMPFVEGESLRDRLSRERLLPQGEILRLTQEVASALQYAHSRGIVHRDIKPENIMLSAGTVLVSDFGIARAVSRAEQQLTDTGMAVGTAAYMSPEQASGGRDIDNRSDQYSLACVVYEMLVGQPPFTGPSVQAILARHSVDHVSPPSIVRETIPDTMEAALLRALAKTPADRFPNVTVFAEALAIPSPVTAASRRKMGDTITSQRSGAHWSRRIWWVPALMLLALTLWGGARLLLLPKPGGSAVVGGLDPRSIAVLYFSDQSRDSSLRYLADGLTETLIDQLGGVRGLRVVSRGGVATYRGVTLQQDSIARALLVGSLIEGSVEPVEDQIHLSVRLVDGTSGVDIERKSFAEPRGDPLRLRNHLSAEVAQFLRVRLGQEVRWHELRAGTSNGSAWLLAVQAEKWRKDGEGLLLTDRGAALRKLSAAESLLMAAEATDPRWIEPVVQRGEIAYRRSRLSEDFKIDSSWISVGLAQAGRALAFDPRYPRALQLRGSLLYWTWLLHGKPDPREAEKLLRDAEADLRESVRLDPSLASAWNTLSHLDYQTAGGAARSRLDATNAYRADAYLSQADVVLWRLFTSSYDLQAFSDADQWCREGKRRFPSHHRFTECQLWVLTFKEKPPPDPSLAWGLLSELQTQTSKEDWPLTQRDAQIEVAVVLVHAGLLDSARHVLARSEWTPEIDPAQDLLYRGAYAWTLAGDNDKAVELLERYIAGHEERRTDLNHWWFKNLIRDPRYQRLLAGRP